MTKKIEKYPEGYLPKLFYYEEQIRVTLAAGDLVKVRFFIEKYRYFLEQHLEYLKKLKNNPK